MAIPPQQIRFYEFGPFLINCAERIMLREGEVVPLTPKQFDLLLVLVESCDHVVEKERLMQEVWPDSAVEEGNLTTNISTLRKALEDGTNGQRYIQTLPRRGYRFVGPVREISDDVQTLTRQHAQATKLSEQEDDEAKVGKPKTLDPSRWVKGGARWLAVLAAASLLIVIVAVVLSRLWSTPKPAAPNGKISIAVLPFKPVAADDRNEALQLGMADTLINKLSGTRQLIVLPLSDVRKYAGLEQNPVAAGRELGVDYVLEGNLQVDGDTTRMTARLLNIKDGSTVWTDKCDQACNKMFELQDAIAERIAVALLLELNGEEKKQLTKHYTENEDAYRVYTLGVLERDSKKKVEYFDQAIKIDPKYALAYSGLCNAYYPLLSRALSPTKETQQKYEWAALMAVELDDTLSEAHAQLAYVKEYNWDWAGAEKEFKRALELNPNSYGSHQAYNWFLVDVGRLDEALVIAERAEKLAEKLNINPRPLLAYVYLHKREYDKAIELYLKNPPGQMFLLSQAYLAKEMYSEAINQMQRVVGNENSSVGWSGNPMLAYIYALAGKRNEALRILGEQNELAKERYISPFNFAVIYLGLGDKDRTFEYLERAYQEHPQTLVHLKSQPMFDSLRSDLRYTKLLQKINLAP